MPFEQTTIGPCTLYRADCLDVMPTLQARSIGAVIADPPYAIPTVVASGREETRTIGDLSLIEAAFRVVFDGAVRVLENSGRLFVFCDGVSYPVVFRAAYGRLSTALLVWSKGRIGMGREFRKSHELVMHGWLPETPIYSDGIGRPDVLSFSPVGVDRVHDAEKPVDLVEELLTVCTGTILDPFMGSGTTGVACIRTEREFVGIEIDPQTFDLACRRIEREWQDKRSELPFEKPEPLRQLELIGA